MKTIIVPFDFSTYSLAALKTAQKISNKSGSKIIAVTVIPSDLDYENLTEEAKKKFSEIAEEKEEAQSILPKYIDEVAPSKSEIEFVVKVGTPSERILKAIQEFEAELVVMGAHGKGFAEGKFIGSTLQKVMRNAACPVLGVKEALDGNDLRKVAFASTFNEGSKKAFETLKSLIKPFKCSVHLLFVNTPEHFTASDVIKTGMDSFQKGNEEIVFHQHVYNANEVESGLINFSQEHGIKWLVVVSGHHETSPSYQVGVTETVLFKSDLGVLSVKI